MRILHYTLGFFPYRSGGLTRYAKDLMVSQRRFGYDVAAFYPSGSNIFKNLKSASNLNDNLNCSKELEHYAS